MLGAMLASAAIHLSDELPVRQRLLHQKISLFREHCARLGLPLVQADDFSPIFFVRVGKPKVGFEIGARLQEAGYLLSIGVYPAVSLNNTGMRATVSVDHSDEQIIGMLETMARILPSALKNHDATLPEVYRAFKMAMP